MHELFARCASGFEHVLADELKELGCQRVRPLQGGVAFFGTTKDAYRACLTSRVATRIQLVLGRVPAVDAAQLYDGVLQLAWEEHVAEGATIAVRAHGTNAGLRNTQFTALKVKDAVCDRLRQVRGLRPDVDVRNPGFAIDVALHRDSATFYVNLSGESLHRRGYREPGVQTAAPLKETLAAGMLRVSGWHKLVGHEAGFVDPMCGSGTLAIEAAQMASGIAPGLLRARWGFEGWAQHDAACWQQLVEQARAQSGLPGGAVRILASDIDASAVRIAQADALRAKVADLVEFKIADAAEVQSSLEGLPSVGLLATNPPYGQRLQAADGSDALYCALGHVADALPSAWRMAVITPDAALDTALGRVPESVLECRNGPMPAAIRIYRTETASATRLDVVSLAGVDCRVPVAEANSVQFAARLRKVAKERAKWARRAGVSCYRLYDADLPDYACAIDLYQDAETGRRHLRLAEYQAPPEVDPARAQRRFGDARAVAAAVLDVDSSQVYCKVRKQAKGGGQYREAKGASEIVLVDEASYLLEVDLGGRLDTGLFLDHRDTRAMVGLMAKGKRFANLFAYTGTATVHAAGGGAASTVSVDLSNTYLGWAKRNMQANGFSGPQHRFVRADVLEWLKAEAERGAAYDLVFCDPPTFSNSKATERRTFDVQRDHARLLQAVATVLAPGGTIVFSCNRRSFRLDEYALAKAGLVARDITEETIPHDFARTPKVHRCFIVQPG